MGRSVAMVSLRATGACALVVGVAAAVAARAQVSPRTVPAPLVVPLLDQLPSLDGRLDEAVWADAAVARDFTQTEPEGGQPSRFPSEVRVYSTSRYLVVGARLADDDPSRIAATEYTRDANLDAEDALEIFLDTFHDGRNAFYFATNAVGVQRDGLVRNEGETLNFEWDGVWEVAAARDARGWSAEFVIPFATLRFRAGRDQSWGVNFRRLVARTREKSAWAPISRDWGFNAQYRVSSFGRMSGFAQARPAGRLTVKPYVLTGAEQDFEDDSGAVEPRLELGLDAKVALSSTVVADLTANTDFAQVESDQQQVNLTRFPLFFPEKREFFLENAGLFFLGERMRPFEPPATVLFFSRRIGLTEDGDPVPLVGGARVTGKLGRWDIGALDIVQDAFDVPEPEEDEPARLPRTNFGVLRVKRDVGHRSSVGAMLTSKTPADEGSWNQVFAADTTIALPRNANLNAFAAKSWTGLTGSSHALGVDLTWERDAAGLVATYLDIGDDFNAEMGFLQRTGVRKMRLGGSVNPRPRVWNIRQMFLIEDFTSIETREGDLESQNNFLGAATYFNDGTFGFAGWANVGEGLTEEFEIRDGVFIPIGTYRFDQCVGQLETDRSRRLSANLQWAVGGFYSGTLGSSTMGARVRPADRLVIDLQYSRNDVNLPVAGGDFVTNLIVARAGFAFSTRAFVRALYQINDDDEESRLNVLLRWIWRPGSDLFVVYNEDRSIHGAGPPVIRREFLVKATVYWMPSR